MAAVLILRVALVLTPIGYRLVTSPQPSTGSQVLHVTRSLWNRLFDADESPSVLADELTAINGMVVSVTDFTGTFEGRRMSVRWSRVGASGTTDDQAQTSIHFLKVSSGAPAAWVDGTDDAAIETAFGTLWTSIKNAYKSGIHLDVYRWNKSGPAWDITPAPYNPAYRVTEVDVAGTGTGSMLPPQDAVSVTFKTSIRKRWGRCYMPATTIDVLSAEGRFTAASTWATAWTTFLNACSAGGRQPVVMSRAHEAYTTEKGKSIAAQPFTAYPILQVQVDDVFDVIRSRRWSTPLVRANGTITPAP